MELRVNIMRTTMASSKSNNKPYDVFSAVDEMVSKPVVGSDGAAKWQDFRKDCKTSNRPSVAPSLPMKKSDRVAGLGNMKKERIEEQRIRKEAGDAQMGQGYTVFKRKNDAEKHRANKKQKHIVDRVRPEDVDYFIHANEFQGWKQDYVFTTKNNVTGYYWDGMDSVKALMNKGKDKEEKSSFTEKATNRNATNDEGIAQQVKKKKKKKEKKRAASTPTMIDGTNNPLEQVANAIRRRNQMMHVPPTGTQQQQQQQLETTDLPKGWETATDPSRGKEYYFNRATGETLWDLSLLSSKEDSSKGNNDTGNGMLPAGWSQALDPETNKEYFYHSSGDVKWNRPTT